MYSNYSMRKKSILMIILLTFITCGLYIFVWMYQTTRDLNELTEDYSVNPAAVIIFTLLTCGIYQIYWWYCVGQRMTSIQFRQGFRQPSDNKVLFLVLSLFKLDIANMVILQTDLNLAWQGVGETKPSSNTSDSDDSDEWTDY